MEIAGWVEISAPDSMRHSVMPNGTRCIVHGGIFPYTKAAGRILARNDFDMDYAGIRITMVAAWRSDGSHGLIAMADDEVPRGASFRCKHDDPRMFFHFRKSTDVIRPDGSGQGMAAWTDAELRRHDALRLPAGELEMTGE